MDEQQPAMAARRGFGSRYAISLRLWRHIPFPDFIAVTFVSDYTSGVTVVNVEFLNALEGLYMRYGPVLLLLLLATAVTAQQPANPRQQPGATITMFAPEQHDLYDGHYVLSANRIYMVGGLNDPAGWDHMDNDAKSVKPVAGTAEIDVNDLTNTGKFEVRLKIPEGDLVLAIDKFNEFNPCQNGGIVGFLHEHGTDSGCGDNNWPKTFVYLAGWGFGHATLNGKPLYDNYEMHFMVTQGIRDRKTLRVNYPMANKRQPAGEVNPATQQIDFYIRSLQQNPKNKPNREVFLHFFGMEVTWK
jgi:hypothetical protein